MDNRDLGLESVDVSAEGSGRQWLVGAALLLVAIVAVALLLPPLLYSLFYAETDRGSCLILDSNQCESLTQRRIQLMAEVTLPAGAEMIDSGSSYSPKEGREYALILVPEGKSLGLSDSYVEREVPAQDSILLESAHRHGIKHIEKFFVSELLSSVVFVGQDDSGRLLASVTVDWAG